MAEGSCDAGVDAPQGLLGTQRDCLGVVAFLAVGSVTRSASSFSLEEVPAVPRAAR